MSPQQRAAIRAINSAASELIADILSDKTTDQCTDFTAHFHLDRCFTVEQPYATVTVRHSLYKYATAAAPQGVSRD